MSNTQYLVGTEDLSLVEARMTWRAYLICAFACFGGESYCELNLLFSQYLT